MTLPLADPEVASRSFTSHLEKYWSNSSREAKGWSRTSIDDLHTVVTIPARRADGGVEPFYFRLGAEYYDAFPPTVLIVAPEDGWPRARAGTTWWPMVAPLPWCALHDTYAFTDPVGQPMREGQLVCFSMTAEYYMSNHSPTDAQRWTPGRHTVAATLSRLGEILSPPHYGGPGAPRSA